MTRLAGQQRLAQRVVDLVGAGMGQVLALEVQPQLWDGARGAAGGSVPNRVGKAVRAVERRGTAGELLEEDAELCPEAGVVAQLGVGALELLKGGHQRFGDVPPTERAVEAPPSARVRLDEARVDDGGTGGKVRAIESRRARPLGEQGERERVLARPPAGDGRRLDPGCDVDADRRHPAKRSRHRVRCQPAGENDGHLASDGRRQLSRDADPRPAGMRPAGCVEQDTGGAMVDPGADARHDVGRRFRGAGSDRLPRGSLDLAHEPRRLLAAQLDDVRVERGDDRVELVGAAVDGDGDDLRSPSGRGGPADEAGKGHRLGQIEGPRGPGDEVEPHGVDAAPDGSQDPGLIGDPADLHHRRARPVSEVVRVAARSHEARGGGARIGRPHQRLPDERGIEADGPPRGDEVGLADAGLGDRQSVARDSLAQADGALRIDDQAGHVAVVEPDQPGARSEGAVELPLVVRLHQRLETQGQRLLDEPAEASGRVERRDEQHEIRPGGAEELQLARLDHEVLGQDREGDGGPDRAQVVDRAAEPVRLTQHGDGRRAAALVGPGEGDGVEVAGGKRPGRWRAALDLGDEVQPRRGEALGDRAGRRRGGEPAAPIRSAGGCEQRAHLLTPPRGDLRDDVRPARARPAGRRLEQGHAGASAGARLASAAFSARRLSSSVAARPASMVRAASSMADSSVASRPAATSAAAAFSRTTSRRAPLSPRSTASTSRALAAGSPPARADVGRRTRPRAAASTVRRSTPSGVTS
jgi:hypothetical protein